MTGDELARGKAFFKLGATRHSSDHRLLAWLADEAGSEFYTARVRDTETRVDLADVPLRASRFIFVWRKRKSECAKDPTPPDPLASGAEESKCAHPASFCLAQIRV